MATDKQRHEIDQGLRGDKVPFPDPAMAPLGTDEEAGGGRAIPDQAGAPLRTGDGDASAKTVSGEPRNRSHRIWIPAGLLLLLLAALLVVYQGYTGSGSLDLGGTGYQAAPGE